MYGVALLITLLVSHSLSRLVLKANEPNELIEPNPIVATSGGYVVGRSVKVNTDIAYVNVSTNENDVNVSTVNVFYGIPYARPPVGELRFRHPVIPAKGWSGNRDCRQKASICVQHLLIEGVRTVDRGSEDCLYLNVFAPDSDSRKSSKGHAVMVYLHGGSFAVGAGSEDRFESSVLAAMANVVVVTVNYRLGFFGFSYSGTEESPGNSGVYDVIAALEWVRQNAAHFGGDPDQVTLSGNSAGSIIAGALSYSPLTKGLIRRVALISGTPVILSKISSSTDDAIEVTSGLATAAGCGENSTAVHDVLLAIRCLKQLPLDVLNKLQSQVDSYSPILDGSAVINFDRGSGDEIANRSIDFLIGNTRDDGSFLLLGQFDFIVDRSNVTISSDQLMTVINSESRGFNFTEGQRLLLKYQYNNWLDPANDGENLRMASNLKTDVVFVCPSVSLANLLSSLGVKAFVYIFNQRPFELDFPSWPGVHHCSDIAYIFGHPFRVPGYSRAEAELSARIMNHYGHFMNYGNPSFEEFEWPSVSVMGPKCMSFSLHDIDVEFGPRTMQCALWSAILPNMDNNCSEQGSTGNGI